MPVDHAEDIARAICSDKYDGTRFASSLFKGENTSVSRLAITPMEDSWELFQGRVERPPERTLEHIGTINAGKLYAVGIGFASNPTELTVEPDPLEDYPSHAVIPQRVSKGLANAIIRELEVHALPATYRRRT